MQDEFLPVAALDVGYGETKVSWLTRGQPICKVSRPQVEQANSLDLVAHPGFSNVRGYLSYGACISQREKTAAAGGE